MKIYKLIPALIIALIFTSCTKEGEVTTKKNSIKVNNGTAMYFGITTMPFYIVNPSNPDNPMDSFGIIHNEGIHYIYNHLSSLTSQNIIEIAQNLTRDLYSDNSINLFDSIKLINTNGIFMNWQVGYKPNESNIEKLHKKGLISDLCKNYLLELESIALINKDLEELIKKCKNIENEILASNVSSQEKNILLGSASVLRYSAAYWFSIAGSNNHIIMTPDLTSDLPTWLYPMLNKKVYDGWNENRTCKKDFEGFYTGGFAGLFTGCVPAAGAAAIGAMLGASTFDIWDQWNGNWGGGGGSPSATLKGNPNETDPLGTIFEPRFSIEKTNDGSSLEIRLATILRPNSIKILNTNNEILKTITEIPNFELSIDISDLQTGQYNVIVQTNTNSITKQFLK